MPYSDSQLKATRKYKSKAIKQVMIDVNMKTRPKLYQYLTEDVENVTGYIRNLIYEDMKRQGKEID